MQAFLISTARRARRDRRQDAVARLILAARFRKPVPIVLGILVATLVNHALAGWPARWSARGYDPKCCGGRSSAFLGDRGVDADSGQDRRGPKAARPRGGASSRRPCAFFLAEIGDKTQVATVGARRAIQLLAGRGRHDHRDAAGERAGGAVRQPGRRSPAAEGHQDHHSGGVCRARRRHSRRDRQLSGALRVIARVRRCRGGRSRPASRSVDRGVGAALRLGDRRAERGDVEHAAAIGDQPLAVAPRAGVEDLRRPVAAAAVEAADLAALLRACRDSRWRPSRRVSAASSCQRRSTALRARRRAPRAAPAADRSSAASSAPGIRDRRSGHCIRSASGPSAVIISPA